MKIIGNLYVIKTLQYRLSYKKASRPTGLDGIVVLLNGYDPSLCLWYWYKVKLILSGKIKQMKARLIWKYVGIDMTT